MSDLYFSALKKGKAMEIVEGYEPVPLLQNFAIERGILACYDVCNGLPDAMKNCDVFYTDVAWPSGIKAFEKSAGLPIDYKHYVESIANHARWTDKPFFVVGGKLIKNKLKAQYERPIELNGDDAVLYSWNSQLWAHTAVDLLELLSTKFENIGDFCCGLGRSGQIFHKNGKRFVMSDINGKCIRYLYEKRQEIFGCS